MCSVDIFDVISEINPEALSIEGYDDCIIGVCESLYHSTVIVYDKKKIIDKLIFDGMDYFEAERYFKNNILDDDVGQHAPIFITRLDAT